MNDIINYKVHTGNASKLFSSTNSLSELEANYGGDSLIEIQKRMTDDEIIKSNMHLKKILAQPIKFSSIKGKKTSVTKEEANILYQAMANSKVHKKHDSYDAKGTIGFCFGRATIAHMEAVARDIHPDAIRKIWIAGDMGIWGHHVATMIKAENGWLVLDTNVGRPITSDEWIKMYMPYKVKDTNEIMVFVTQAGRFGPYDTSSYNAVDLFNTNSLNFNKAHDYYSGYFHDYFEDLDNSARPPLFKKVPGTN